MILGFAPSGNAYNKGVLLTVLYLGIAMLFAMLVSGAAAVGLEFVALPAAAKTQRARTDLPDHRDRHVLRHPGVRALHPADDHQGLRRATTRSNRSSWSSPRCSSPVFGASVTNVTMVIIVAALVFAVVTDIAINRTKFGRGIRAVAQDPTTATLMGVSRERIIMTTFLIGGLLAGAAALLYTLKVPQGIIYSGGFLLGIKAFSAAVLGGIGNLRGALLGGLILGVMEMYGQVVFGTQWRDVVAFVLLVLVLLIRPDRHTR